MDRDGAGGVVGDHLGDDEWADLARPAGDVATVLLFELVQSTDAAAENDPAAEGIFLGKVETAVLDCCDGRDERELRETVQPARGLRLDDVFGAEALHLAAEVNAEVFRIELFDPADPASAGAKGAPERLQVARQRVHRPHPGDDDAA